MNDGDDSGVTVERVRPGSDAVATLTELLEDYRAHYGAERDPGRAHAWLRAHLADGRLVGYVAWATGGSDRDADGRPTPAGMALAAPTSATLRLATWWWLRDVYVAPDVRRHGVGTALVDAVVADARADGAVRVGLRTEEGNDAARALYAGRGFEVVEGLVTLVLPL